VYCEALGLPLVNHPSPLPELAGNEFLYADLPGLSLRHPEENRAHARFLESERIEGRILVLNAAYDTATLRDGYVAGRDLGATHVVFTHLDEVGQWGKLWDFLLDGELSPLFFCTGPSLTGDCEEDVISAILRKTLPSS
jgi:flagellar biosynthesis protein FlhF